MSRQSWMVLAVTVALIGSAAVVCEYIKTHRRLGHPGVRVVAEPSLDLTGKAVRAESVALPERVLDYESKAMGITGEELSALPGDTLFGRRSYDLTNQVPILMTVVLMGGDSRSIHKPEICLPSQGWRIQEEPAEVKLNSAGGGILPVMKVTASKTLTGPDGAAQKVSAVFVYWFVADAVVTRSHGERMWRMAMEVLRSGTLQRWAYVSCVTYCEPGQEAATYGRLERFIGAAVPQFQVTGGR